MKAITREWLARAGEDLLAAETLLTRKELTNLVAFHAQQTVEKAFKAVLEELAIDLIRTHSLIRLYELLRVHLPFDVDRDMLDRLEAVYIEARYPGEMGLLPYGKPTLMDAASFHSFARQVYEQIQVVVARNEDDDLV